MGQGQHVHELLHVTAATLFVLAGASALREYRVLRERVVLTYGAACLCAAGYASHVAISHSLPKVGAFWIPWTATVLLITFGATFFYLLTMQIYVGVRSRIFRAALVLQAGLMVVVLADVLLYAVTRRSFMFVPVPRSDVSESQRAVGEGVYSLLPMANVVAVLFKIGRAHV